jgi:uncharacterized membrane protein
MHPWEIHPALIHFPIAFLLGGLLIDLYARIRPRESLTRVASGLLVAGVVSGLVAAGAGLVSYYTVPAHTEAAHEQMDAHMVLAGAALGLFALVAVGRWMRRTKPAGAATLVGGMAASALLVSAAMLGGKTVYQGGAGVDPQILAPAIVQGHHHHHDDGDDDHDEHAEAADHDHTEAPAQVTPAPVVPEHHHVHPPAARRAPPKRAPLFDPEDLSR